MKFPGNTTVFQKYLHLGSSSKFQEIFNLIIRIENHFSFLILWFVGFWFMCCLLTYSFECWFAKGQCKSYIHSTQKSVRRSKPRIEQSFPCSSVGKGPACNAGDLGSIPWSGRSLEKEMATQTSILAWRILWTEEPGSL